MRGYIFDTISLDWKKAQMLTTLSFEIFNKCTNFYIKQIFRISCSKLNIDWHPSSSLSGELSICKPSLLIRPTSPRPRHEWKLIKSTGILVSVTPLKNVGGAEKRRGSPCCWAGWVIFTRTGNESTERKRMQWSTKFLLGLRVFSCFRKVNLFVYVRGFNEAFAINERFLLVERGRESNQKLFGKIVLF